MHCNMNDERFYLRMTFRTFTFRQSLPFGSGLKEQKNFLEHTLFHFLCDICMEIYQEIAYNGAYSIRDKWNIKNASSNSKLVPWQTLTQSTILVIQYFLELLPEEKGKVMKR